MTPTPTNSTVPTSSNPQLSSTASTEPSGDSSISLIKTREGAITKVTGDGLTGPNWVTWRVRMISLLTLCEVEGYVRGEIKQPNQEDDPIGFANWKRNDNYAKHLITQNVADEPLVHIQQGGTSHTAWHNLESIYEDKSQETAVAIIRNLWHTTAEEDDDIGEHLTKLKKYWERLNLVDDDNFKIPEVQFKIAIISSLPVSWDTFTRPYISTKKGDNTDSKVHATSQELIGTLKEEYQRRLERAGKRKVGDQVNQVNYKQSKPSLANRLQDAPRCGQCGMRSHLTYQCRFLGQSKCATCERFGHKTEECLSRKAKEQKTGNKRKGESKGNKKDKKKRKKEEKSKIEEVNEGEEEEEEDDEHIVFNVEDTLPTPITIDSSEEGQYFHLSESYVYNTRDEFEPPLIYYDWLADSATTSHVCNRREAFHSFHQLTATKVTGVGNTSVEAQGRGTIELVSNYNNREYILELHNVLYIPKNNNNLIALGKWDKDGRKFKGENGILTLYATNGVPVAQGSKVGNNLYKMKVAIRDTKVSTPKAIQIKPHIFSLNGTTQNWETWHRRFGHTSYSRLQYMLDNDLVHGFTVDTKSPKPDCVACTESKQTIKPFSKKSEHKSQPGELTHIDLWGKYAVTSINGNNYYILFVDDAERFSTTDFLKQKSEATQKVQEYITYLKTHGKKPRAIRIDRGKEFVNDELQSWCRQNGIEIQMTAPYSPPQNGIAERMNRTLVEPARAMIRGLPEFLWEYAVAHASYIRNRCYTKALENKTPYEIRFKQKPNISHLRDFGSPVWVLLQGIKQPRKMEPKSRRRIFVGFDDGSKSVKYYNNETRRVLTSRNFRFLSLTSDDPPPEVIGITPDPPGEGESERGTQPRSDAQPINGKTSDRLQKGKISDSTLSKDSDSTQPLGTLSDSTQPNRESDSTQPPGTISDSLKRKRNKEINLPDKRITRGIRRDYRYLQNPFPDEEEEINLI
jgi:gag-polypeptide of LTR copia-type/Integrase core domain/GAG-pre-integrase domain